MKLVNGIKEKKKIKKLSFEIRVIKKILKKIYKKIRKIKMKFEFFDDMNNPSNLH